MRETSDADAQRVYTAAALWLCVPWWVGGLIGTVIGSGLSDPGALGLDAVFPAALLAIVWPQLRERDPRVIAILAAVAAIALVGITPGGVPVLVGACAALLALRSAD